MSRWRRVREWLHRRRRRRPAPARLQPSPELVNLIAGPARILYAPQRPIPTSIEEIHGPAGEPINGWVDLIAPSGYPPARWETPELRRWISHGPIAGAGRIQP